MGAESRVSVRTGSSTATDAGTAVAELKAALAQPDCGLVVFFCSSHYDLPELTAALDGAFDCTVIGCTTAGEVSSAGFREHSIVGTSIASPELRAHCRLIEDLQGFEPQQAEALAASLMDELQLVAPDDCDRMFGLLLVDGLSAREEHIVAPLYWHLQGVPIVGGSAGDDQQFQRTHVYFDGRFHTNAAVFALIETTLPFRAFRTQHFAASPQRLVITASDPQTRVVREINGVPAAQAYAGAIGIAPSELTTTVFSRHPVMLRVGDEYYVRSIGNHNPDDSLTFYAAIENGVVLNLATCQDLVQNLAAQLDTLETELPSIQLILGFDCVLRRLDIAQGDLWEPVQAQLRRHPFVGFSTYGEQFNSVHVNQTLSGVALGG
jgi:hypothetical protein